MVHLIEDENRIDAWLKACEFLMAEESHLNVIMSISNPASNGPNGKIATALVDNYLKKIGAYPLHTVAETIFPGWEYRRSGFAEMSRVYVEQTFPAIEKLRDITWGTYAHRLLSRRRADGTYMNPLAQLIEKMKAEHALPGPKKSCYELGVNEGAHDAPLYSTVEDETRHMGGPCLSHTSFKLHENAVHLTAIYRSHDYGVKVLGNLLGLARLQACVANEVGAKIGTMVIHSTYAYVKSSAPFRKLLNDVATAMNSSKGESNVLAH